MLNQSYYVTQCRLKLNLLPYQSQYIIKPNWMRKRIYVFSQLHVNAHIFASIHVYIRACICILIGMHSHTPTLIRDPYSNYLWKNKGKIVRIYEPHVSISISPIINASTYINYIFILDAYFFFNVKANSHALFDL